MRTFEADLSGTPSNYMCTEQCPCPPSTSTDNWYSKFVNAGSYEARYSNFIARAADSRFRRNFTITTNLTEFRVASNQGRNTPLYVNVTTRTYDNFFACY